MAELYEHPSGLYVPHSAANHGVGHGHGPAHNRSPRQEQLDNEVIAAREDYADKLIDSGALDQRGIIFGSLYREDAEVGQAREDYLESVVDYMTHDFEQEQAAAAQLHSPLRSPSQPGMTHDEVDDATAQGEQNDKLTTLAIAEWDTLTNTLIEKIPVEGRRRKKKLKEIFSRQNARDIKSDSKEMAKQAVTPVGAGLAAVAFNSLVHLGPVETLPYIAAAGGSFAATKLRASKDALNATNPSKNPDTDVKGKVMGYLDALQFDLPRNEQATVVETWMRENNIDTGAISSLSSYRKEREALADYLKEELETGSKTQDQLRVEMAVKLTFLEQEYARTKQMKAERKPLAIKRALGAGAVMVVALFGVHDITEKAEQQREQDRQEQKEQEYIDQLPDNQDGDPSNDTPTDSWSDGLIE